MQIGRQEAGVAQTHGLIGRPIRRVTELTTHAPIGERVRRWTQEGQPSAGIAEPLNADGHRPADGTAFGIQEIHDLRRRLALTGLRAADA